LASSTEPPVVADNTWGTSRTAGSSGGTPFFSPLGGSRLVRTALPSVTSCCAWEFNDIALCGKGDSGIGSASAVPSGLPEAVSLAMRSNRPTTWPHLHLERPIGQDEQPMSGNQRSGAAATAATVISSTAVVAAASGSATRAPSADANEQHVRSPHRWQNRHRLIPGNNQVVRYSFEIN